MQEFNKETLAKFDGQNGNKAYVAANGKVYDVTGNPHWQAGKHHGVLAGKDVTEALSHSPHGDSVLANLTVVGTYKD